jgi:gamma-butyrobetaine dioxygenase
MGHAGVEIADGHLTVAWPDGRRTHLHAVWLREHGRASIDAATGQRRAPAFDGRSPLAVTDAAVDGGVLLLTFSDGVQDAIGLDQLAAWTGPQPDLRDLRAMAEPWTAASPMPRPVPFEDYRTQPRARREALTRLARDGFVQIEGVPPVDGGLTAVTDPIGPIKETNFGRIEDVRAVLRPTDLTLTAAGIEQHTDNPYRWPAPGYTVLHCLRNAVAGGGSTLVDGLSAVARLGAEAPHQLDVLCRVEPTFRYEDRDTILEVRAPLIERDAGGAIRQIRFSHRTEFVPPLPLEALTLYYAARRRFAALLQDEALVRRFRFMPGLLTIMDNWRCLHGREPYEAQSGDRHLQICFLDRDVVASRLRVMARDEGAVRC